MLQNHLQVDGTWPRISGAISCQVLLFWPPASFGETSPRSMASTRCWWRTWSPVSRSGGRHSVRTMPSKTKGPVVLPRSPLFGDGGHGACGTVRAEVKATGLLQRWKIQVWPDVAPVVLSRFFGAESPRESRGLSRLKQRSQSVLHSENMDRSGAKRPPSRTAIGDGNV